MELPRTLKRIYDATAWKVGQAVERFVQPTELARQRDGRSDPTNQLARYVAESEVMSNPNALVTSTIPEPDKAYIKQILKGGEYKDLPVNNWIDWSIKLARSSLVDHALGNFGRAALMTEAMLGDDRIQTAFDGRVKGITKTEPVFISGKGAAAQKVVEELTENWEEIMPEETIEEFMTWAVFEGFCLAEVIWEPWKNQNLWLPRLKVWHPFYIYFRQDIRKFVAITEGGTIEIEPNDPKWILYTPYGYYRGWLKGRVRSCAIPWLVRQFALRDLARFSEVHGMPMRVAKYPAQAPTEDKARFVAGIRNLGAETTVGLPIQAGPDAVAWGVELVEAKDTSWEAFIALRDACNSSITLSIRGTNLTSEVGTGNSGNRAAAEVHQDEDNDYAMTDRRKVMTMLRKQLFPWYCIFNHGDTEAVPTRKSAFVHPEDKDIETVFKGMQAAAATVVAVRAAGGPIDAEKIYARADIPLIEGREKESNDETKALPPPGTDPNGPPGAPPGKGKPPGKNEGGKRPPDGEEDGEKSSKKSSDEEEKKPSKDKKSNKEEDGEKPPDKKKDEKGKSEEKSGKGKEAREKARFLASEKFDESKHARDNDGKFSEGGGGGGSKSKEESSEKDSGSKEKSKSGDSKRDQEESFSDKDLSEKEKVWSDSSDVEREWKIDELATQRDDRISDLQDEHFETLESIRSRVEEKESELDQHRLTDPLEDYEEIASKIEDKIEYEDFEHQLEEKKGEIADDVANKKGELEDLVQEIENESELIDEIKGDIKDIRSEIENMDPSDVKGLAESKEYLENLEKKLEASKAEKARLTEDLKQQKERSKSEIAAIKEVGKQELEAIKNHKLQLEKDFEAAKAHDQAEKQRLEKEHALKEESLKEELKQERSKAAREIKESRQNLRTKTREAQDAYEKAVKELG